MQRPAIRERLTIAPGVETWAYPMELGKPLPELPLPLGGDVVVPLELEGSYEDTCRVLRIA
ncbi:MAG TPA: hypothetical protein VN641_05255 [Urbifossiella sp.]|nr:hypothetical protein [Urbifossiella sp.]